MLLVVMEEVLSVVISSTILVVMQVANIASVLQAACAALCIL